MGPPTVLWGLNLGPKEPRTPAVPWPLGPPPLAPGGAEPVLTPGGQGPHLPSENSETSSSVLA